jgi:hypothetical protein
MHYEGNMQSRRSGGNRNFPAWGVSTQELSSNGDRIIPLGRDNSSDEPDNMQDRNAVSGINSCPLLTTTGSGAQQGSRLDRADALRQRNNLHFYGFFAEHRKGSTRSTAKAVRAI